MGAHAADQPGLGHRDFSDRQVQADLNGWLTARARTTPDRTGVLIHLATARLLEARVLLPGPSLLERLVAGVRDTVAQRLHAELAALPDPAQQARLRSLLEVGPDSRMSRLESRNRARARVEDRIRTGKDTGIGHLPCRHTHINAAWVELA